MDEPPVWRVVSSPAVFASPVEDYLAAKVIQARYLVLSCQPCRFFRHGERGGKRTDAAERQESHYRSCDTRTHGLGSQKSSRKGGRVALERLAPTQRRVHDVDFAASAAKNSSRVLSPFINSR